MIVAYLGAGLIGFVVLLALIGLALPKGHVASRSAVIPRPPADVYAAIADATAYPTWRKDVRQILAHAEIDGRPSYVEVSTQGRIVMIVDEDRPPREGAAGRRITRIDPRTPSFGGKWIITVTPDAAGSRVTVTEDGYITNPIFRVLSKTVFSLVKTQETFLRDLGRHFGAEVTPAPVEAAP
jgi:hypothetical protein